MRCLVVLTVSVCIVFFSLLVNVFSAVSLDYACVFDDAAVTIVDVVWFVVPVFFTQYFPSLPPKSLVHNIQTAAMFQLLLCVIIWLYVFDCRRF